MSYVGESVARTRNNTLCSINNTVTGKLTKMDNFARPSRQRRNVTM
jgi:hypothetical protein